MIHLPAPRALVALAAAAGLAGCTYGGYDSGFSIGYGTGYYDDGYYGYSGAPAYYGWYDDYYYPGAGYYVYDRGGQRYRWNDRQRHYWQSRAERREDRREVRENWAGYRQEQRRDDRQFRAERRENRQDLRSGAITRPEFRAEQRADRREYRRESRDNRRDLRRQNRRDRRD